MAPLIAGTLMALGSLAAAGNDPEPPPVVEKLPDGRSSRPSAESVYFPASSAALDDDARRVIDRHVARLAANPRLAVTLVAHTDELGSTALEIARGQDRLNVVLKVLEDARISTWRIRSINLGSESGTVTDCSDDACRRLRRRIDFLFHR